MGSIKQRHTTDQIDNVLSGLISTNEKIVNQIITLKEDIYQPSLSLAMENQLAAFNSITTSIVEKLPRIDEHVSAQAKMAREATLSVCNFANNINIINMKNYSDQINTCIIYATNTSICANDYLAATSESKLATQPIIELSSQINKAIEPIKMANLIVQTNIAKISGLSIMAEDALSTIQIDKMGSAICLSAEAQSNISGSCIQLLDEYKNVITSYNNNVNAYIDLSPIVARQTSVEYFNNADLLKCISVSEKEENIERQIVKNGILIENERGLKHYLSKIDNELYDLWIGANIAMRDPTNPDKIRHFGTSMRELLTKVVHALAPDDEIKRWTTNEDDYFNNIPTRRTRLRYICRNIDGIDMSKFVEKDIAAFIELIELLNGCSHKTKSQLNDVQLLATKSRAESAINYLIMISNHGK